MASGIRRKSIATTILRQLNTSERSGKLPTHRYAEIHGAQPDERDWLTEI